MGWLAAKGDQIQKHTKLHPWPDGFVQHKTEQAARKEARLNAAVDLMPTVAEQRSEAAFGFGGDQGEGSEAARKVNQGPVLQSPEVIAELFSANHITGDTMLSLNNADLIDLGVESLGVRKYLLANIDWLNRDARKKKELTVLHQPQADEDKAHSHSIEQRRSAYESMAIIATLIGGASAALFGQITVDMDHEHKVFVMVTQSLAVVSMTSSLYGAMMLMLQIYFIARLGAGGLSSVPVVESFFSNTLDTRHRAVKAVVFSLPVFLISTGLFCFGIDNEHWVGSAGGALAIFAATVTGIGIKSTGNAYSTANALLVNAGEMTPEEKARQKHAHVVF